MTTKDAGAKCPSCADFPCAEYVQMNGQPQWACLKCGASGWLNGKISLAHAAAPAKAPPPPKVAPKGLVRFVLVALAAFVLTLASVPINAGVFRGNGFTVEMTDEACTSVNAFMVLMASGVMSEPKLAKVRVEGRVEILVACYAVLDEEDYLVVMDNGGGGVIPRVAVTDAKLRL